MTSEENSSGARATARTPIIELTECPTRTTSASSSSRHSVDDVVGVALERRVPDRVVRRQVRASGAEVVEQHHPVVAAKSAATNRHIALVAPEPVREQHGLRPAGSPSTVTW